MQWDNCGVFENSCKCTWIKSEIQTIIDERWEIFTVDLNNVTCSLFEKFFKSLCVASVLQPPMCDITCKHCTLPVFARKWIWNSKLQSQIVNKIVEHN